MRCHNFLRQCCLLLMLGPVVLTAAAVNKQETLYTSAGDAVTVDYEITVSDGKTIVCFNDATVKLGHQNKRFASNKDNKTLKVIFIDGTNFEQGYQVEWERGGKIESFTTPAGWNYVKDSSGKSHIFPINDTGRCQLTFEGGQDKKELKIPLYLAVYEHKDAKKVIGIGRGASTSYKIFSKFGPLKVELSVPKKNSAPVNSNAVAGGVHTTQEQQVEYEDVTIDSGDDETSLTTAELDREARDLINRIKSRMENCSTEEDYAQLEIDMNNLDKYWQGASSEVKGEIDGLKKDFNAGRAAAGQAAASAAAAEQAAAEAADSEKAKEQEDKNRKDKWWMFIIAAVLGVLGFGGSQVSQHLRNKKNQQSMMDMQQNVVKRAENEAKRRAQSFARNKSHQMVGQVKQKGRQAVRSGVTKAGDNIRGKQSSNSGNAVAGGTGGQGGRITANKNKNNKKGGISI